MKVVGVALILLGLALLVAVLFPWAPLEEPASPGKTPNPSRAPWKASEVDLNEYRRAVWIGRFMRYGAIPTGLLLIGGGIWLLIPERRPKE